MTTNSRYNYFYCNHGGHFLRSTTRSAGFTHHCKGKDSNEREWNAHVYVRPNTPFSDKAIQKTTACTEHQINSIDECLCNVFAHKSKLSHLFDEYKYANDLKKSLRYHSTHVRASVRQKNESTCNVNEPMDLDDASKDTFNESTIKTVKITHDDTNNAFFKQLASRKTVQKSTSAWFNITSNTGIPRQNAQKKLQNTKQINKTQTTYLSKPKNENIYPYLIVHQKADYPSIFDFMNASDNSD
eukprot:404676_1